MRDPQPLATSDWHLAQANIAKMRAPLDDPVMAGFVAQLEAINAAAEQAAGFVWRLQTEQGDATAIRVFDDETILFNLSVWRSVEELHTYVYHSAHAGSFRDRQAWFLPSPRPHLALWWVPAGQPPTVAEAVERLDWIRDHGPGPRAFTFKQRLAPPPPTARSAPPRGVRPS